MNDVKDAKLTDRELEPGEEQLADLAAFVLSGRPERVEDGVLMMAPQAFRAAVRDTREVLATLGRAETPAAPSANVRAKLLDSLTRRTTRKALVVIDSSQKIDLLFTDMIMPGSMNGRQLADAALQRRASLKVLFTSGYSNEAIIHHGHLDAGVLLLAKPYRKADLAHMIRAALAA